MSKSSEKRAQFRKELIKALRTYAMEIARKYPTIKLVMLYGSFARGDWHSGSDADILIIADELPPTYGERWDLFQTIIMGISVEPHAYTPKELEDMLKHGRMTALDALTEGIILYAEPEYITKLKRELTSVMKCLKLRKIGNAWIRRH